MQLHPFQLDLFNYLSNSFLLIIENSRTPDHWESKIWNTKFKKTNVDIIHLYPYVLLLVCIFTVYAPLPVCCAIHSSTSSSSRTCNSLSWSQKLYQHYQKRDWLQRYHRHYWYLPLITSIMYQHLYQWYNCLPRYHQYYRFQWYHDLVNAVKFLSTEK